MFSSKPIFSPKFYWTMYDISYTPVCREDLVVNA